MTTTVVLSWLLIAQTGQSNPFSQRDPDAAPPRKTSPAATLQDDNDAPPPAAKKAASPWADETPAVTAPKPNFQREAPTTEPRQNPFRRDVATEPSNDAPAWGKGAATPPTNRFPAAGTAATIQDDPTGPAAAPNHSRTTVTDPRATVESPARSTGWGHQATTPERPTGNGTNLESGLLLPLSKAKSVTVGGELITQGLVPPKGVSLPGRPLTLLEAVSRSGDRQQQLRTARIYWRLATAQIDYYWAIDELQMFEPLQPRKKPHEAQAIKAAQASAAAHVHEAELAVRTAQSDLAELIRPASFETLPLVHDAPFVGAYKTYFEQLFSDRGAPGRTRNIDQNLPVRRDLVEARAKAVVACNEVADALAEGYRKNECDTTDLIAAVAELRRERHDFLTAVRDYNYDIAEYATSVATSSTSAQTLVSMMIRVNRPAVESAQQPNRNNSLNRSEQPAATNIRRSSFDDEPRNSFEMRTTPVEPRRLPAAEQPSRDLRFQEVPEQTQAEPTANADGKKLFSVMVKPGTEPSRTGPAFGSNPSVEPAATDRTAAPAATSPFDRRVLPALTTPASAEQASPAARFQAVPLTQPSAELAPAKNLGNGRDELPEAPPFRPAGR